MIKKTSSPNRIAGTRNGLAAYLLLTVAYIVSGKLGLMLALPPGYSSPIFPPAGIAVAAALIGGRKTLPWTFLGSLLLNLWVSYSARQHINDVGLAAAILIATASMLQAAIGGWGLRRSIGYPTALDHSGQVVRFLLLAPVICLTSASLSGCGLLALGIIEPGSFVENWAAWWVGDMFGVIVMLPLAMTVVGEPRVLWRSRRFTVAIPILLILALFVSIFLRANSWEYNDSLSDFRQLSQQAVSQVQTKLEEQEALLEQMAGLFIQNTNGPVTQEEFHRFVGKPLHRFSMIQALEWAPEVDAANRASFEEAHSDALHGFEIREQNDAQTMQRAGHRALYYPVTYIEPFSRNEPALGFDLASNPKRREPLIKAIQSGATITTGPVHLVQESQQQEGILLLLAVNPNDRKSGVVLTVLRMSDFMEKLLRDTRPMLYTRLIDLDEQESLYDNFQPGTSQALYENTFDFGTRHYRLETAPTPAYLMQHHGWQSWGVLCAGILGTGLLGALLLLGTGYTARVETKVENRTKDLKESQSRLSNILDHAPIGMAIANLDGRLIQVNSALCSMLGYEKDELEKMRVLEITHRDDAARSLANVKRLLDGEVDYYRSEKRYLRKDGQIVWALLASSIEKDDNGVPIYIIGQIEDITERHKAEKELTEQLHFVAQLINSIPNPLFFKDDQGRYLSCNKAFETYFGRTREEIIGKSVYELSPKELADRYHAADKAAFENPGVVQMYEANVQTADGQERNVMFYKATFDKPDGSLGGLVGVILDITERKQAERALSESESRFREIFNTVNDAILIHDAETGRIVDVNPRMLEMYGLTREEALTRRFNEMSAGTAPYSSVEALEKIRLARTEGPQTFDWLARKKNGDLFWVEASLRSALIGNRHRILAVVRDITKQKNTEVQIHHLAYYDGLTDLPNRTLFSDRLQQALATAKRDKLRLALMFLDLDKFKPINDTLGHHVGDMLLVEAAKRMRECVRESDTVARLGGDEFGVLLPVIKSKEDAMLVAEKIREALNQPFFLVGQKLNISSSAGIAVYPDHGDDEEQMLRNADIAMYFAKESGRNNVKFYLPSMADDPQKDGD
ncbi:MAG: PAS domain S-box protein [Burkholderiaceae bacterium]|nr:PAS domain S-box protein [Burkholderiaceae bacterium]